MDRFKRIMIGILTVILSISTGSISVWSAEAARPKVINDVKLVQSYEEVIKVLDEKSKIAITGEYYLESMSQRESQNSSQEDLKHNLSIKDVSQGNVVKTDERYIYSCIGRKSVVIVDTKEKMKKVSTINLESEEKQYLMNELFLDHDHLTIVLKGSEGEKKIQDGVKNLFKNFTVIKIYNIKDKQNPTLERTVKIEGNANKVTKIKNQIVVVSNRLIDYGAYEGLSEKYKQRAVIPNYKDSANGNQMNLVPAKSIRYADWSTCDYYTILANFDISNKKPVNFNVLLGNAIGSYMNQDGIYLVNDMYDKDGVYESNHNLSIIIKYGIELDKINYKCVGMIPGETLDLDVYKGNLRVATTSVVKNTVNSNLYILDDKLQVCGKIEGFAKGTKFRGTRFDGDKGYMIPAKETDSVWVLELSYAKNPRTLGKFKLPGFNQYVQPIGKDLVVGVERNTSTQGIKLTLVDVKNPKSPVEINHINIGTKGSYSEALDNYAACMIDTNRRILAIPVILEYAKPTYIAKNQQSMNFQGAYVFDVEYGKLTEKAKLGQIDAKTKAYVSNYQYTESRICYIGDNMYHLYANQINCYEMRSYKCTDTIILDK
ncbi:beta-propeller domain-containing protein [Cellulosilyticum ruminicola]|uniref:beta-propeller domain-containing protein n=1 Tax=Cellulosilyticum ruminicola TaxID=425254 RepID=UPI0006D2219C|nr:beta-propeller domain-containing protein [Cellulosilyticum ruminicola]